MGMVFNANLETRQSRMCKRCGGQLIRSHEEINCLQCGAPHTEEGKLVLAISAQEYEALLALQKSVPDAEVTQEKSVPVLH